MLSDGEDPFLETHEDSELQTNEVVIADSSDDDEELDVE